MQGSEEESILMMYHDPFVTLSAGTDARATFVSEKKCTRRLLVADCAESRRNVSMRDRVWIGSGVETEMESQETPPQTQCPLPDNDVDYTSLDDDSETESPCTCDLKMTSLSRTKLNESNRVKETKVVLIYIVPSFHGKRSVCDTSSPRAIVTTIITHGSTHGHQYP